MSLADIDRDYAKTPGFRLVPELPLIQGGVDPLGLRQINLDLMDRALPGINNVTRFVRPYLVMTWAWWKAEELARESSIQSIATGKLQGFADRIDALFVWSHFISDLKFDLPGRNVIKREFPLASSDETFPFQGKRWDAISRMRRKSTGLMAPINYGPSIRTLNGIGWLAPTPDGVLIPVEEVMGAVKSFDGIIGRKPPPDVLALKSAAVSVQTAKKLFKAWNLSNPTAQEKEAFRGRFFGSNDVETHQGRLSERRATLRLIIDVLRSAKKPCGLDQIRLRMFQPPANAAIEPSIFFAHQVWRALQLRQLQRIATEALLFFIEDRIDRAGRPVGSATLAKDACALTIEEVGDEVSSTSRALLDAALRQLGKPTKRDRVVFSLIEEIRNAQIENQPNVLPALAIKSFAIVESLGLELKQQLSSASVEMLLGGPTDRLPLKLFFERLSKLENDPPLVFWREVIDGWVLGQHVRWSVVRNVDETQRLRLALDEGGWVRLRARRSTFGPTPDRLASALSLASDCGLIRQTDDGWTAA